MSLGAFARGAGVVLLVLAAACTPTCEETCDHLVACGERLGDVPTAAECEESCTAERTLYEKWTDESLRDAFDDELSCIVGATCEELEAGTCADPALEPFSGR